MIPPPPRSPPFPYTTLFRSPHLPLPPHHLENHLRVTRQHRLLQAPRHPKQRIEERHEPRRDESRTPAQHLSIETDRKSTRLNSSHPSISYAVFCLKKKKNTT